MAIKLQSASLNDSFSYISLSDGAVDTECETFKEDWERYRDGNVDSPPLKDGEEPTIFELTPIASVSQRALLQGVLDAHGRTAWAVATAAQGITNISGLKGEDGKAFKLLRVRVDGYSTIVEEQLSLLGREVLSEIGAVLINHSRPKTD